jgi:hypothetical protein
MKRTLFILIICLISTSANPQVSVGGLMGVDSSYRIYHTMTPAEKERIDKLEQLERDRQEKLKIERIHQAEIDKAALSIYLKNKAEDNRQKIVTFRLQQATNGNVTYQYMIATNYLKGTDGFPTNIVLSQYWYNKATTR